MSQKLDNLMMNFNKLVELKFKEFLYIFLKNYYHNATCEKLTHILMNLPLGYFLNEKDISHIFKNGKPLSYNEVIELLSKKNIKSIIEEDECHTNG